jgi:hypothetical protein
MTRGHEAGGKRNGRQQYRSRDKDSPVLSGYGEEKGLDYAA